MTEIYVNHEYKKGVIAPCKCGSSAFGNILFMLDDSSKNHWAQYKTNQETRLASDVIANHQLSGYDFIGIARDPAEWYVSGFRFVQQKIKNKELNEEHAYWNFPTTFQHHLETIDKLHFLGFGNFEYDEWWIDHCMLNPYMHFTKNTTVIDLGDWHKIKKWLDSFFVLQHDFYVVNKTSKKIPYPVLDYNNIFMLKKLFNNFWIGSATPVIYNIDKSVKDYILKR